MKKRNVFLMAALAGTFTACSDNDDSSASNGETTIDPSEVSFIVASNDATKSLKGGTRMKVYTDVGYAYEGLHRCRENMDQ